MKSAVVLVLACWACVVWSSVPETSAMEKYLFNDTEVSIFSTQCLDGSHSGFYYHYGTETNKWVIYLEGGGYCLPNPPSDNIQPCSARVNTNLGSSKKWPSTMQGQRIFSTDETSNPDFYNWNHVFVPYCNGDLHSGQHTRADKDGFHFSGHRTIIGLISKLINEKELGSATDVILGGDSAGGIGVSINVNYIANLLPKTRVVGYPNAGWFISVPPYSNNVYPILNASILAYNTFDSYVNEGCAKHYGDKAFLCIAANFSYSFWGVESFIAENIYDTNQLYRQDGVPEGNHSPSVTEYETFFGNTMRATLKEVIITPSAGIFLSSCLQHVLPWQQTLINNLTLQQTFGHWYFKSGPHGKNIDTCKGIACNPTC